jgi:hypothetical protein
MNLAPDRKSAIETELKRPITEAEEHALATGQATVQKTAYGFSSLLYMRPAGHPSDMRILSDDQ